MGYMQNVVFEWPIPVITTVPNAPNNSPMKKKTSTRRAELAELSTSRVNFILHVAHYINYVCISLDKISQLYLKVNIECFRIGMPYYIMLIVVWSGGRF